MAVGKGIGKSAECVCVCVRVCDDEGVLQSHGGWCLLAGGGLHLSLSLLPHPPNLGPATSRFLLLAAFAAAAAGGIRRYTACLYRRMDGMHGPVATSTPRVGAVGCPDREPSTQQSRLLREEKDRAAAAFAGWLDDCRCPG